MRPEISAVIANEMYIAVPNEGAYSLIQPEILQNPLIFPTAEEFADAEFYAPISQEAQTIRQEIWDHFVATQP